MTRASSSREGGTVRSSLVVLAVVVAAAGAVVAGARADGSPYAPGLVYGASGVRAPNGSLRYVTLSTPRSTIVAAIRVRSGRVLRSRILRGFYGIPLVAFDNSAAGLSGDGRTLVVASYGPYPGTAGSTSFVALSTKTLKTVRKLTLRGSWAFDAISPDGHRLFLIEYLSVENRLHYRVRSLDLGTGTLDPDPIADRREEEVLMRGQPVTRKTGLDGRWAYTLYARAGEPPFVHALDTQEREAYCIDLPLRLRQLEQMGLRLRVTHDGTLEVRNARATLAVIDLEKLEVTKT
jgi:hypothetical protein